MTDQLHDFAARLAASELSLEPIDQISAEAEISISDAYRIQLINIERKLAAGDNITGKKIGLTSKVMQDLLSVDQPDFGHLLASMAVSKNRTDRTTMVQPRVEGEIAFVLASDLPRSGVTADDVLKATQYVVPAIEIVDSRIKDWQLTIIDTVADNASAGRYVLGDARVDPATVDLRTVRMELLRNGELVNSGHSSAVLSDPAYAVAWLANAMGTFGVSLKAGEVILSGAISAMVPVEAGDSFTARFDTLGDVTVSFD